jgi:hypothetical protein
MNHPARMLGICLCAMLMATSAFATPPARAADETLTLSLQPGLHGPGFTAPFTLTPAPDIPPGAIVIAVPLYPAAVPTAERESIPALDYSLTPYLKSDGAAYLLPADPATALAWYRQAFAAPAPSACMRIATWCALTHRSRCGRSGDAVRPPLRRHSEM